MKTTKQITAKEYEAIIKEIAARIKDLVYMTSESDIKEGFPKNILESILGEPDSRLEVNYKVNIVVDDIIQILGRTRREKKNHFVEKIGRNEKEWDHSIMYGYL